MTCALYNELDPFCADWLRRLIDAGQIAPGVVDERSIEELAGDDVAEFDQVHLFAGIGGWSHALRLAGWPDDEPVWTGSCPCQPLSSAGLRKGHADERHLWPAFHRLVAECAPPVVFGEQVASKDGREWLAAVRADLESLGYACGAADLPAISVGALHRRHRIWIVAHARGSDVPRFESKRASLCRLPGEASTKHGDDGISSGLWDSPDTCPAVWDDGLRRPVGIVRAYGNAIVPPLAAEFIAAAREAIGESA